MQLFGTDGIRGLAIDNMKADKSAITAFVENREFSCGLLRLVGEALGVFLREPQKTRPLVIIGWDDRPLNPVLVKSLTLGLHLSGTEVCWAGEISTPCLHSTLLNSNADAGCMITASHNPIEDSGIKLFDCNGYKSMPKDEIEIEKLIEQLASEEREVDIPLIEEFSEPDQQITDSLEKYRSLLLQRFGCFVETFGGGKQNIEHSLASDTLFIDASRSVAHTWLSSWINTLGISAIELSSGCEALNRGCGAGELSPTDEWSWADMMNGDFGHVLLDHLGEIIAKEGGKPAYWRAGGIIAAALDGDGDRCLLIELKEDESGLSVVDGDKMADALIRAGNNLPNQNGNWTLAASIESDIGLLSSLSRFDQTVRGIQTAVGDRWLSAALQPEGAPRRFLFGNILPTCIGCEDSGHIVLPVAHPSLENHWGLVGDGIATMLAVLCAMGFLNTYSDSPEKFVNGWKMRKSVDKTKRSLWDGKNEYSTRVETLVNDWFSKQLTLDYWKRNEVVGETSLLMIEAEHEGELISLGVRNSGTQAKTNISLRMTSKIVKKLDYPPGDLVDLVDLLLTKLLVR